MKAIVNVNLDWAIGKNNELINRFPEDMAFFKSHTKGNTIIYGRNTLASFPNEAPLPGRKNIVVTSDIFNIHKKSIDKSDYYLSMIGDSKTPSMTLSSLTVNNPKANPTLLVSVNSIQSAIDAANIIGDPENVYVCGGASIYKQMLQYCDTVYVTLCYNQCEEADAFFPCLDLYVQQGTWEIVDRSGKLISKSGIEYEFLAYSRVQK